MDKINIFDEVVDNSRLRDLNIVDLNGSDIEELPLEICYHKNLISLTLRDNQIKGLPSKLNLLSNLAILDISNNPISLLPESLPERLTYLHANNCRISELPRTLKELRYLKFLDFRNNPLPIPLEILEKTNDPQAILSYYFQYGTQEKIPFNEAKMIVVGERGVGKTTLTNKLIGKIDETDIAIPRGVLIRKWRIQTSKQETVSKDLKQLRVNVWDFGGQEIAYYTHKFFLTKRSLYLLIADINKPAKDNRIEYWVGAIKSSANESPIIIVGNKSDQDNPALDNVDKSYRNVKGFFKTSCISGNGIPSLQSAIADEILSLPHVLDELPATWFKIKDQIEGSTEDFISYDRYINICQTNGVHNRSEQESLLDFLHEAGIILNYYDDPALIDTIVLNPNWVTNGIYKILNSYQLLESKGLLEYGNLKEILESDYYPPNRISFIVEIMKKFQMCFALDGDKYTHFIPILLPQEETYTGAWKNSLRTGYQYNCLPESIISLFTTRMYKYIKQNTIWRYGVVLVKKDCHALVKADYAKRTIQIWIENDKFNQSEFLTEIRSHLESIHKSYPEVVAVEIKPPILVYRERLLYLIKKGTNPILLFLLTPLSALLLVPTTILIPIVWLIDKIRERSYYIKFDLASIQVSNINETHDKRIDATEIFVSYAHKDKSFAKKLARTLESWGTKVWWDFDRLKGGQDWQKEIEKGIKQCDFFLVILTPDAIASEWVGNEITYASNVQKMIIPLHLKKCDIPISLIKKQYIDFEKQTQKAAIKELIERLKDKA